MKYKTVKLNNICMTDNAQAKNFTSVKYSNHNYSVSSGLVGMQKIFKN